MNEDGKRLQKAQVIAALLADSITANEDQKLPNSYLKLSDVKEIADVFLAAIRPKAIARFGPGEMELAQLEHIKESHAFPGLSYAIATKLPDSVKNLDSYALVVLVGDRLVYELYAFENGDTARTFMQGFVDVEADFPDNYLFKLYADENNRDVILKINDEMYKFGIDSLPDEVIAGIKNISKEFSPKSN